ncbi:MAG: hypothetical protein MRY32_08085 [Rickettsiales bacterium]|nr:hypothetical protein [Rickettsiales bacterium]
MNTRPQNRVIEVEYDPHQLIQEILSAPWQNDGHENKRAWFPASMAGAIVRMTGVSGSLRKDGIVENRFDSPNWRQSALKRVDCADKGGEHQAVVIASAEDLANIERVYGDKIPKLCANERAGKAARDR